jgi:hypothetical protein
MLRFHFVQRKLFVPRVIGIGIGHLGVDHVCCLYVHILKAFLITLFVIQSD